ncbi:MAG: N-6 DNA methylase [Clostridia bacterium]|nr:N-6 DNA methylase [Clostridia bacterium]
MIRKDNLEEMLSFLGYIKDSKKKIYEKRYEAFDCMIQVDFSGAGSINYPEEKGMKITRKTTCNFSDPENFVVLECVTRLMDKGYRPEHIALEPRWALGHEVKGGYADILVTNEDGKTLFIIECKTDGNEYKKELNQTLTDGGQLFSYWQQEKGCQWLALYASNFDGEKITYTTESVDCNDDANILVSANKDKSIRLYRNAHTVEELYSVWKDTYEKRLCGDVIFRDDSQAYNIGVKPRQKKDLVDFTPDDKIVNRFEEILRHNNVSDKENAFNRLIALFICKLVDESTKSEDDEVEFQYKQGTDTYETLQDRLQRLHRDGMEKFMKEEIYYISSDYPEWLFSTYTGSKRRRAIEDLQKTIKILKFYSNNDFAFKDVHNEELFYQNGKILVEMVQLFEKYRIVYPSKHQFLGDLFEQLLNKGFKQNEGQFFTPMPITRFIWDSLPIERMVKSDRGTVYPKVIDYACGAGHFLTEAVETINFHVASNGDNAWVRDHIYGIEKDYRLARVAKISLFMNGAGEGNIIFGDGLENAPDKGVDSGSFDILVANPPYSVKDFKQHLQLKNNSFSLLDRIGLNGGEIETLFVERIGQLLKPKGIAAVILPSSLLSNDNSSYIGARELLLKQFYLRGIVEFGSKTFGATGTTTVVMFLEKFNEPPKRMDLSSDCVEAVFNDEVLDDWKDREVLEEYLEHIDVDRDEYVSFLKKELSFEDLKGIEYFNMYVADFNDSTEAKTLKRKKGYKKLSLEEQDKLYLELFYTYARAIEEEKLFYFSLVYQQTTVIVNAPSENEEQKLFLGYGWSNRKGNEGIQIITPGGQLYDDSDRTASGTLANAIKRSYDGLYSSLTEEQQKHAAIVNTKDILDFKRSSFNKSIRPKVNAEIKYQTKYEKMPLGQLADVVKGSAITQAETVPGDYKVVAGGTSYAYKHNQFNRDEEIITVSASGANAGYVNYWNEKIYASDCTTIQASNPTTTKWIYYFLKYLQDKIYLVLQKGSGQPHVYKDDLKLIPIPVIDDDIQEKIVKACSKIDNERKVAVSSIEECKEEIRKLYENLDSKANGKNKISLSNAEKFIVQIGQRVVKKQLVPTGEIPVYSANTNEPFGHIDQLLIKDFSLPSVLWGIDGDWMTSYMPAKVKFYPTDHCGVLRCKTNDVHPKYLVHLLEIEGKKAGFSRSYRASMDRIEGLTLTIPDRKEQDKTIAKIEEIEKKLEKTQKQLASLENEIGKVIEKHIS